MLTAVAASTLVGARRPRMFRIAAEYADMWNAPWHNRAERTQPAVADIDAACRDAGRDQQTLIRTAGVMVDIDDAEPNRDWILSRLIRGPSDPLSGSVPEIADELRRYERLGFEHLQIWLNPCTERGLEAFAPVLALLDQQKVE